ncbi:Gamma-butyrobetaine dioxygenase-like isoform X1 [Oopsacas minuta]|uniref:Gamma-butyrobetaine dioxygenase-like isoform X1 n=1 Tax=Oopsacas minuta TaxID=111878 RepID=A0AAV7K8C4_9METZ|nr:Gamma-butyrobetaine dioxygenase-like isoform X1 [Oopsacas minuta]
MRKLLPILTLHSNTSYLSTQSNFFLNQTIPKDPAFIVKKHRILPDNKKLAIQWQQDDIPNHFHAMWLRHQCHCGECTHITSGQRFQDPQVLRSPVIIQEARVSDDRLELKWRNAEQETHPGFVPLKWLHLQRESIQSDIGREEPYKLCELDFEEVLSSEQGLYEYLYKLNQHGVVQISNTPKGGVLKLSDAISHRYDSIWGREFEYGLKIDPNTLAYSNKALRYHLDLPYMQNKPGIAYLHCLQYDTCVEGGVLTVKDGMKIAKRFKEIYPEFYQTLSTVKVKFAYFSHNQEACYIRETTHFRVDVNGNLEEFSWAPNVQISLSNTNNGEESEKYTIAYYEFNKMIEEFPERVDIKYRAGVMAVFHNTRMLHMRNCLNLNGGVRHIHGCYSPIDEYRSKLRYLCFKQGRSLPATICNKKEKIILRLGQSQTSPNPINWDDVKAVLTCGIHNKFIPKSQSKTKNWGEEAMTRFPSPETTKSKEGLDKFLSGLKDGRLKVKTDKLVWVECILRGEHPDSKQIEIKAAEVNIYKPNTHVNIITFSSIDDDDDFQNHLSSLQD